MTAQAAFASPRDRAIHVLAVDDSAVTRELMSRMLPDGSGLTVEVAADPVIAIRKIRVKRPDVILLDLQLPRIDGLTFLRHLMANDPIPVVVCSSVAERGTKLALDALAEGAFDVLGKPQRAAGGQLEKTAANFRSVLRAAAGPAGGSAASGAPRALRSRPPAPPARPPLASAPARRFQVVAIGTSTGGPQALYEILSSLAADCPGIVIVQHMPATFTAALARWLDERCRIRVKEAEQGDLVEPGKALLAPGDRHLMLVRSGARFSVALADGPNVSGHKPSVDVLFKSVARAARSSACGVILTGMGADGAQGLAEMRAAGAHTLGQNEASSVVYGMPQRAFEIGAVERVVDLAEVASAIAGGRPG
ncbi:MAG: chemotaxis response regulator protein-glutamate methylesterase [Myxococcota bacterium]